MSSASGFDVASGDLEPQYGEEWACEEVFVEEFDALSISIKPTPVEKYPAKLHARNVAKQLGEKAGLLYLVGTPSGDIQDSDQPKFFRQRRYFYYLSGIDLPDCVVTYNIQRDHLLAFILPQYTGRTVIYNGLNPSREEILAKYDFDHVTYLDSLTGYISHFANREDGSIYTLHKTQSPKFTSFFPNDTSGKFQGCPVDYTLLKEAMNASRVIKSPYEIKMLRKANGISAQAHINVLRSIKALKNESEIEAIFTATCIAKKAKQQAYGIIAGSGENASTLHYGANDEPLKGRQLVCLDAGCEWKCYASDVTRTFPISGKFTAEAKQIYDLVAKMQEECIEMVKPGANFIDINQHAIFVATEGLIKLGLLINGSLEEIYEAHAAIAFFPHGLGHFMGLEVHDVGDWNAQPKAKPYSVPALMNTPPSTSTTAILRPNMVTTIEPGIYFSRYSIEFYSQDPKIAKYITRDKELLEKYYAVGGVRIEDDILVTEEGYENLTSTPKGDEALRIINGEDEGAAAVEKIRGGWFW